MPRNISFALTTNQIRNRTKTVTRRLGWDFLKAGDVLNACVKCQGLKKGEHPERLCQIRVVSARKERLSVMCERAIYGEQESVREGFPEKSAKQFVAMFAEHMKCSVHDEVNRIEFEYLEGEGGEL